MAYPENHADAVASILSYAGNETDFHPSEGVEKPAASFHSYIKKISEFPAFTTTFHKSSSAGTASLSPEVMSGAVLDAYKGVLDLDAQAVIDSIVRISKTVQSSTSAHESNTLFSQVTLKKQNDSDKYYVSIFFTSFNMGKEETTTTEKRNIITTVHESQEFVINRTVFDVNTSMLVANADILAQEITIVPVMKWFKHASSPIKPGVSSCYEKDLVHKEI
ncbi:MAG: hypothetical protein JOS17DRAFT_842875 [Linnemannia elongata]|nr:MAG: hypothetical protein JOS17DRAFT_842875 [Linnemannia elongata]